MPLPAIIVLWMMCSMLLFMIFFFSTEELTLDNPWSIKGLAARMVRLWTKFTDNFPDLEIQPTFAEFAITGWLVICTPFMAVATVVMAVAAISIGIPVWMSFGLGWSFAFIKRKAKQYANDPRWDHSVRS